MNGPKCSLCHKEHWQRDGCDGKLQERVARTTKRVGSGQRKGPTQTAEVHAVRSKAPNTQREGRRVLKAKTGSSAPVEATRSPATAKANPSPPAKAPADIGHEEKPGIGTPKPRRAELAPKSKPAKKRKKTRAKAHTTKPSDTRESK